MQGETHAENGHLSCALRFSAGGFLRPRTAWCKTILNQVKKLVGDVLLGGEGDFGAGAIALEDKKAVGLGGETAARGGDVVGAEHIAVLANELVCRIGGKVVGFGCKADKERLVRQGTDSSQNVGRAPHLQCEELRLPFFDFLFGVLDGRKVRHCRAENCHI